MDQKPIREELFEGTVSVQRGSGWLQPWRLPCERLPLYASPNDTLVERARTAAGVRVRCRTGAAAVGLKVVAADADRRFDLTLGDELHESAVLPAGQAEIVFTELPATDQTVEIWLPQGHVVQVEAVLVEKGATVAPAADRRPRWVTYGSSISHCNAAHSPARTWPATAARERGLHLTCLGYGGNCHLEPMVARMIRDLPADVITLKVGINIQGGASLGPRTFMAAAIGFVEIIREVHQTTPLAILSPIISPPREAQDNAVGLSLQKMRTALREAVDCLRDVNDDEHLHYFDGLKLFDQAWIDECLPDNLHPNGDGYERLGRRFAERVLQPMGF